MKRLAFATLLLMIIISICYVVLISNEARYIPGSYKALDMFSYIRAYPQSDIPAAAYTKAYRQHLKLKESSSITKSNNNTWQAQGPHNTAGRALSVAVNPQDPYTVYMGSASGGLWRSRNLGLEQSWEYMPTGYPVLGVSTIAFPESDSMTMYIGTGEVYNFFSTGTDGAYRSTRGSYGIGILKSEDGGRSWEKSLDWTYQQNHGVWMIKVAPTNPDVVYAATTQGVFKSVDAGESWENILDVIMCTDIEIDPRDNNRVITSSGNFGTENRGIYRTVNGGESWIKTTPGDWFNFQGKILLARANSNPDVLYASIGNGFGFNDGATWLLRTDDNGKSWETVNDFDYSKWQGWFSHDIAVNPNDENEIIAVGIDIYKSTDGGISLEQKSNGGVSLGTPPIDGPDGSEDYSHSDHHFVAYHPGLEDHILFGNDGGLFLSQDGGESFRSANGGLQTTQFYNGFSVSRSDTSFAIGGLQDNSTVIYRGDAAWQRVIGGDGSWSAINQNEPNVVFASYQNLNILKSLNSGLHFFNSGISFRPNETPLFISPYVISDSVDPVMYAGGIYVYRSDDQAESWTASNNGLPLNGDPVFCMDVFDPDPDVVYVGTVGFFEPPRVFVTQDGGDNWTDSGLDFPDRIPNDIAIHPFDPSIAYVCFSGFGSDHLYYTENFGASWQPMGNALPDVPFNAIAIDPADPNIIYIGSDISVYVSTDAGLNWEILSSGLPDALIVMDLKVSPSDRKLWLASHGNGAYKTDMLLSIVDTDEELAAKSIDLYPNPVQSILNIDANGSDINWQIFDLQGKLILAGTHKKINVESLLSGHYFIRIESGKTILGNMRFIKI